MSPLPSPVLKEETAKVYVLSSYQAEVIPPKKTARPTELVPEVGDVAQIAFAKKAFTSEENSSVSPSRRPLVNNSTESTLTFYGASEGTVEGSSLTRKTEETVVHESVEENQSSLQVGDVVHHVETIPIREELVITVETSSLVESQPPEIGWKSIREEVILNIESTRLVEQRPSSKQGRILVGIVDSPSEKLHVENKYVAVVYPPTCVEQPVVDVVSVGDVQQRQRRQPVMVMEKSVEEEEMIITEVTEEEIEEIQPIDEETFSPPIQLQETITPELAEMQEHATPLSPDHSTAYSDAVPTETREPVMSIVVKDRYKSQTYIVPKPRKFVRTESWPDVDENKLKSPTTLSPTSPREKLLDQPKFFYIKTVLYGQDQPIKSLSLAYQDIAEHPGRTAKQRDTYSTDPMVLTLGRPPLRATFTPVNPKSPTDEDVVEPAKLTDLESPKEASLPRIKHYKRVQTITTEKAPDNDSPDKLYSAGTDEYLTEPANVSNLQSEPDFNSMPSVHTYPKCPTNEDLIEPANVNDVQSELDFDVMFPVTSDAPERLGPVSADFEPVSPVSPSYYQPLHQGSPEEPYRSRRGRRVWSDSTSSDSECSIDIIDIQHLSTDDELDDAVIISSRLITDEDVIEVDNVKPVETAVDFSFLEHGEENELPLIKSYRRTQTLTQESVDHVGDDSPNTKIPPIDAVSEKQQSPTTTTKNDEEDNDDEPWTILSRPDLLDNLQESSVDDYDPSTPTVTESPKEASLPRIKHYKRVQTITTEEAPDNDSPDKLHSCLLYTSPSPRDS